MKELEDFLTANPDHSVEIQWVPGTRAFRATVRSGPRQVSMLASAVVSRASKFLEAPIGSSLAVHLAIQECAHWGVAE